MTDGRAGSKGSFGGAGWGAGAEGTEGRGEDDVPGQLEQARAYARLKVAQGRKVVRQNKRHEVGPHSARGSPYLKLNWRYLRRFLLDVPSYVLLNILQLTGEPNSEPAMASKTQHNKPRQEHFNPLNFGSPDEVTSFPSLALAV